jgi:hypothetical protein
MTDESIALLARVAIVQARAATALIKMEGMKARNAEREQHGHALAYNEDAFEQVFLDEGIYHNAVMSTLYGE